MLISMPTGTSTIFGAFQAILALLQVKPDVLRPPDNVIRNEKFASGIFSFARDVQQCCDAQFFRSWPPVRRQINDASIGSSGDLSSLRGSAGPLRPIPDKPTVKK